MRSAARHGKKAVSAYFSLEVSRGLNVLAAENGTTLQALMGEAIDLLMRQYGKHPSENDRKCPRLPANKYAC